MEPRIQFAKTSDGINIAYYEVGDGPPFIHAPGAITNVQLDWRSAGRRQWYERLAKDYRIIRYDRRGTGLSERNITDYSVEALTRDIEAIADHLQLRQFALWGAGFSGPAAMTFTVMQPERVSKLVLYNVDARGSEMLGMQDETTEYLLERDWVLFTEIYAQRTYEWTESEQIRAEALRIRESITQDGMKLFIQEKRAWDVTDLLSQIKCPTLVLYRPGWAARREISLHIAVAAAIQGARLVALDGTSLAPYVGDTEGLANLVHDFLGEVDQVGARSTLSPAEAALRTIFFTDVEDSTALTQRLGDAKAREVLREHEGAVREALAAHGGSEVKTMGDGFMASFGSATKALECAIAIQRCQESQEDGLRVRIGLNAGEPIAEEEDLFGTAVITAARICRQARGGEILASDVVRQLVAGKGFLFSERGEQPLRGFDDPVRVYEVHWKETP